MIRFMGFDSRGFITFLVIFDAMMNCCKFRVVESAFSNIRNKRFRPCNRQFRGARRFSNKRDHKRKMC